MPSVEMKVANLAKIQAKLAKLPAAAEDALRSELATQVEGLVAAMKANAPVDPTSDNPGAFRDSIRSYPNPDRAIGFRIIADARDAKGKIITSNIEFGHRARDGSHVPGVPSFYPTYRAMKKAMRRALSKAARSAVRAFWGS